MLAVAVLCLGALVSAGDNKTWEQMNPGGGVNTTIYTPRKRGPLDPAPQPVMRRLFDESPTRELVDSHEGASRTAERTTTASDAVDRTTPSEIVPPVEERLRAPVEESTAGRDERQARRQDERRRERAAGGSGGGFWDFLFSSPKTDASGGGQEAQSPEEAAAQTEGDSSQAKAMRGAGRTAQALKAQAGGALGALDSSLGGGRGGRGAVAAGGASAVKPQAAVNAAAAVSPQAYSAANPATPQDFALAATPYRNAFQRQGLESRVDAQGRPYLFNAEENRPATQGELAALAQRIQSEPTALVSNPSFFSTMPRLDFNELKTALAGRPAATDGPLKDVEVTRDKRDVVWAKSCDKASGDCNESADKSYEAGKPVSAEELSKIWAKVRSARSMAQAPTSNADSLARSQSLMSRFSAMAAGLIADADAQDAAAGSAGVFSGVRSWFGGLRRGGPSGGGSVAGANGSGRREALSVPQMASVVASSPQGARGLLAAGGLLAASGLAYLILRRRRDDGADA